MKNIFKGRWLLAYAQSRVEPLWIPQNKAEKKEERAYDLIEVRLRQKMGPSHQKPMSLKC